MAERLRIQSGRLCVCGGRLALGCGQSGCPLTCCGPYSPCTYERVPHPACNQIVRRVLVRFSGSHSYTPTGPNAGGPAHQVPWSYDYDVQGQDETITPFSGAMSLCNNAGPTQPGGTGGEYGFSVATPATPHPPGPNENAVSYRGGYNWRGPASGSYQLPPASAAELGHPQNQVLLASQYQNIGSNGSVTWWLPDPGSPSGYHPTPVSLVLELFAAVRPDGQHRYLLRHTAAIGGGSLASGSFGVELPGGACKPVVVLNYSLTTTTTGSLRNWIRESTGRIEITDNLRDCAGGDCPGCGGNVVAGEVMG